MTRYAAPLLSLGLFIAVTTVASAQSAMPSPPVQRGAATPGVFVVKISAGHGDPRRAAETILAPLAGRFGRLTVRPWIRPSLVAHGGGLHKATFGRRGIDRIMLVEFTGDADPLLIAAKVTGLDGVDYAEPVFRRYIHAGPNDPDIARQWYLERIRAIEAWDSSAIDSTTTIAIVDTGIDWMHPDLAAAIWKNPGENGVDNRGSERRANGIDDDGNGFVDDWVGFDFAGRDARSSDNDPRPGHWHGTHVAGIAAGVADNSIGIAGVAHGARVMALKIADDHRDNPTLVNAYDALVYAVRMGATVINCSWGGAGRMQAEQDVIDAVTDEGVLVVAAAGNDGLQNPSYPASYRNVLSVASVMEADRRSIFSNYNVNVGISAPGDDIYSTMPGSASLTGYGEADGTSMASPMVAAAAALVRTRYPSLDPLQVSAVLRASSDNIDAENPGYHLMLGSGRLNVARALTTGPDAVMAGIESIEILDSNANGIIESGETFNLRVDIRNYLKPASALALRIDRLTGTHVAIADSSYFVGALATGERRRIDSGALTMTARSTARFDHVAEVTLSLVDGSTVITSTRVAINVNPNYATTIGGRVATTLTGNGRIGFNDFPSNDQGIGFRYRDSENLLAEGGLLIGTSASRLADVVRSGDPGQQSDGLHTLVPYRVHDEGATEVGVAQFSDGHLEASQRNGLHITMTSHASRIAGRENQILLMYRITNTSTQTLDRLFAALYLDWDIGVAGANNQIRLDPDHRLGYAFNTRAAGMPYTAAMLVGNQPMNFYAADNNAAPLSGGFFQHEKWEAISSGIRRDESSVGDCSMLVGAGPIALAAGADTTIVFSLIAADDRAGLVAAAAEARAMVEALGMPVGEALVLPSELALFDGYPSPFTTSTNIQFTVPTEGHVEIDAFTAAGEHVVTIARDVYPRGAHSVEFRPDDGSSQVYFIRMVFAGETILKKVVRLGTDT